MDKQRYKRLRELVRGVNRARRAQAKKIDILCNDLVGAQRRFIKLLEKLGFVVQVYESLAGLREQSAVLSTAAEMIRSAISQADLAFFLLDDERLRVSRFASEDSPLAAEDELMKSFTFEACKRVARGNKVCFSEDLPALNGLEIKGGGERSVAAVPLIDGGTTLGFIMLCSAGGRPLTREHLEKVTAIVPGLVRILNCCPEIEHQRKPA